MHSSVILPVRLSSKRFMFDMSAEPLAWDSLDIAFPSSYNEGKAAPRCYFVRGIVLWAGLPFYSHHSCTAVWCYFCCIAIAVDDESAIQVSDDCSCAKSLHRRVFLATASTRINAAVRTDCADDGIESVFQSALDLVLWLFNHVLKNNARLLCKRDDYSRGIRLTDFYSIRTWRIWTFFVCVCDFIFPTSASRWVDNSRGRLRNVLVKALQNTLSTFTLTNLTTSSRETRIDPPTPSIPFLYRSSNKTIR